MIRSAPFPVEKLQKERILFMGGSLKPGKNDSDQPLVERNILSIEKHRGFCGFLRLIGMFCGYLQIRPHAVRIEPHAGARHERDKMR